MIGIDDIKQNSSSANFLVNVLQTGLLINPRVPFEGTIGLINLKFSPVARIAKQSDKNQLNYVTKCAFSYVIKPGL